MLVALFTATAALPATPVPESNQTIIVGGDRDYPPYEYLDQSGHPVGFNVELTRAIAEVMGMKVEFRLGGWSEMRSDLQSGHVDVLEGMSFSEERAREVDFSLPHAIVNHAVFARRDSPSINSLAELAGKSVAVHRGGIMHDMLVREGFTGRLELTPTPADALRLLAAGKTDFAIVAIVPGMYIIRELKLTNLFPAVRNVATHRYGYAVKKGNDELLSRFNEGLAILRKTGQYDLIYNKWLGVLEPEHVDWRAIAKYGAVVFVPLLLLLGGFALWSRTLHRQVALRTADLTREISERKHAEEELRRNQQQLVQADKLAALGVLVSGVAHEINNPTGLILLDVPILKRAHNDTERILEEYYADHGDFTIGGLPYSEMRIEIPRILEEMQDGAKRIKRIVNDLKDFARRDDVAEKEAIDLNSVVGTALRLVEPAVRKATNRLQVNYAEDIPPVRGNSQRIEQVVINLVLNACQALPDNERGISVTTRYNRTTADAILIIRDEGVGIAQENLSRLTDPFFTTKRESGGTGLGLSVSDGIIKEHGGQLYFDSAPGSGTTVTLVLPVINKEET
ncbi:transporter substrate-binding domain-containing protein [Geobacter pelophilus]|uniref:histidine kinase n=1 Tax=Geoanaerobacter pelophilus TaxID=60036 RepID=A0AAW4L1R1_9BACT|nr:transporter substrate-binding domain-containing protein [Geoanaerobacter pelophilus]MBT0665014.1 transporter substrate-binding domain-containing protein [Geoanaerobacter pelophilus]